MSIRVHAVGTDGFRYTRDSYELGDVYNLASLLSIASTTDPIGTGFSAGEQVAGGNAINEGTEAVATITARYQFAGAVTMLLARHSGLIFFLAAHEDNWLADNSDCLPPTRLRSLDAWDLINDINDVLATANLNCFGALEALTGVFSNFDSHRPRPTRLNVTLTH